MNRVLRGEPLAAADVVLPMLLSALLAVLCLVYIARRLRAVAAR
jgi:hypothetical protein